MIQFYVLSVVLNFLVGCMLFLKNVASSDSEEVSEPGADDMEFLDERSDGFAQLFSANSFLRTPVFMLCMGILCVLVAVLKVLSPVNGIFLFGDLFPALAGLAGGISLLVDYYAENSTVDAEIPDILHILLIDFQKYVGIACIAISAVHFLLPGVLFL